MEYTHWITGFSVSSGASMKNISGDRSKGTKGGGQRKTYLYLKTSWTAGPHVWWLCNEVSISKGIARVCASKPSSAKKMLIQDVGIEPRTVFKPNGPEPVTEDMTWQLGQGARFSWDSPIKKIEPILCCCLVAAQNKSTGKRKWAEWEEDEIIE